jgi:ABC-type uncharacterized transport system fused permease/ATPase subunit
MSLRFDVLKQEADLRFALVRVREHSESIAFYRGAAPEQACALDRLRAVVITQLARIRWAALLEIWRNTYVYATILVPSLVTAPRYFAGEIQFGVVTQVLLLCPPGKSGRRLLVRLTLVQVCEQYKPGMCKTTRS